MKPFGSTARFASTLTRADALIAEGRTREASTLARTLLEQAPEDPRCWQLMSTLNLRVGRMEAAIACLARAVACDPTDTAALIRYGQCLARVGRRREALAAAQRAATMPLPSAALCDALGTLYSYCDESAHVYTLFLRAVTASPGNTGYLYNFATAQRMTGDLAGAEISLDRVIAAKPDDYGAYYTRADLRVQSATANHIGELKAVLDRGVLDRSAEVTLCFALAKELEDTGDYDASFRYLERGCDLQRRSMSYDVTEDVETIDRIIERHTHAVTNENRGFDSEECIFVFGLPRSGTTLVERIIGAHSEVYVAGELPAFANQAIQTVQERNGRAVSKLDFVERALDVDPRELGRRYILETRPQTGHTRKFIDKTPLNYLYAALIRRALPRAKLIAVMRDPMDVCYAMYKTLFTGAYPFSYDQSDLGRYYSAWNRLMKHWQSTLGDALLVLKYEELVARQELVSRQMIEHCGIAWEDNCLAFHHQQAPVATASAVQVRQPVYTTSIGKWRHYEVQLATLARYLRV